MKSTRFLEISVAFVAVLSLLVCCGTLRADFIYVGNWANNTIERYDSKGNKTLFASTGINHPEGLALDPAGNLFVINGGDKTIWKFDPSGHGSLFANSDLKVPSGLAWSSNGCLYATDSGDNTITKFDPDGHASLFANTGLQNPTGAVFDKNGVLYVANWGNNTIMKFDGGGHPTLFSDSVLNRPYGLAFDTNGFLYVANDSNNTIQRFDSSGFGTIFANFGMNNPTGIGFDSAGYLYEANFNANNIGRFDVNGQGTQFASGGLNRPIYIAIGAGSTAPRAAAGDDQNTGTNQWSAFTATNTNRAQSVHVTGLLIGAGSIFRLKATNGSFAILLDSRGQQMVNSMNGMDVQVKGILTGRACPDVTTWVSTDGSGGTNTTLAPELQVEEFEKSPLGTHHQGRR